MMRATPNYLQRHGRQLTLSSPPQIVRDLRRDRAERFVYRVLCARQASLVAQVDDMKYRWLCIIMAIFYTWTGISKLICSCQLSTLTECHVFHLFRFFSITAELVRRHWRRWTAGRTNRSVTAAVLMSGQDLDTCKGPELRQSSTPLPCARHPRYDKWLAFRGWSKTNSLATS